MFLFTTYLSFVCVVLYVEMWDGDAKRCGGGSDYGVVASV